MFLKSLSTLIRTFKRNFLNKISGCVWTNALIKREHTRIDCTISDKLIETTERNGKLETLAVMTWKILLLLARWEHKYVAFTTTSKENEQKEDFLWQHHPYHACENSWRAKNMMILHWKMRWKLPLVARFAMIFLSSQANSSLSPPMFRETRRKFVSRRFSHVTKTQKIS